PHCDRAAFGALAGRACDPAYLACINRAPSLCYTLSLHDALPIWAIRSSCPSRRSTCWACPPAHPGSRRARRWTTCARLSQGAPVDRKRTRLNSSHRTTSYVVYRLKTKTATNGKDQSFDKGIHRVG